jgi:hypothetical protein
VSTTQLVGNLQAAMVAFASGQLGERELIAITMAVNDALTGTAGESYAATAKEATAAMIERIAELDRGEP